MWIILVNQDQEWTSVIHKELIDFDLGTQVLEIKTVSEAGSNKRLNVVFYQKSATQLVPFPSYLQIRFSDEITYKVGPCMSKIEPFPSLPEEKDAIWGIQITEAENVKVFCNGKEVLSYDIPYSCSERFSNLRKIVFWRPGDGSDDTASVKFRAVKGESKDFNTLNEKEGTQLQ